MLGIMEIKSVRLGLNSRQEQTAAEVKATSFDSRGQLKKWLPRLWPLNTRFAKVCYMVASTPLT
jgi:hypothetical protein